MFERIKGRSKENLNNAKSILNAIDYHIDNSELINLLYSNFNKLLKEKKYYVVFSTNNEICIKKKKSDDMFHLLISPSVNKFNSISFRIIEKDGLKEKEVTIQFKREDKQIIVIDITIEKNVQGKKGDVSSITNNTTIRNYIDKEMRYEYIHETETCFRLHQNYSCATLSETFVDLNNNAVRRIGHISEDDFYDTPADIVYYESSDYRDKPFNTRYHTRSVSTEMMLSTEEKFNDFINGNNNILNLRKQK